MRVTRRELLATTLLMGGGGLVGCVGRARQITAVHDVGKARAELERTIAARTPMLFVLSADWCGPCRALERDLQACVGRERHVVVAKLSNEETNQILSAVHVKFPRSFEVYAVPSLMANRFGADSKLLFAQEYDGQTGELTETYSGRKVASRPVPAGLTAPVGLDGPAPRRLRRGERRWSLAAPAERNGSHGGVKA